MTGKKLLIVDYDNQSLESLAKLLKPYKFEIIRANDGLSGYEKFKLEKPDLVILEAILPKLHGFDLARRISQDSKGTIPVIFVTGLYRGPQYRHEALTEFGAADYFEKPPDPEKLVQSVLDLLREKIDINLELPDPDSVIAYLSEKVKKPSSPPKEDPSE
jgi:two-component system OmpR family response regulator